MATPKKQTKPKKVPAPANPRRLKQAQYKTLRLSKQIKPLSPKKLPSSLKLFRQSLRLLRQHWKIFGGIILIYGLLYVVLVQGLGSGLNLGELKSSLKNVFTGSFSQLSTGLVLFGALLGSINNTSNASAAVYQAVLILIASLALVWALREVRAGTSLRVRDSFYKGMYPLIPFLLVLMVIGLQLIPLGIGSTVYSLVVNNAIAVTFLEKFLWAALFFALTLLSIYMVTSSVFALYIVTLPDMTPMKALRSARQLVLHRRWVVLRKVLFLPLILLVLSAILIVPLILFVTPLAAWVFFGYSMLGLALIHGYMYTLYRELL
ncbi:MAG: hypothetical protein JWS12_471 [Candidatus Saccharibacteria bacterium]|nr:hypothetical protein [Candidatus Saccharibacteria bacterium]